LVFATESISKPSLAVSGLTDDFSRSGLVTGHILQ
jgi:hypothetical protein